MGGLHGSSPLARGLLRQAPQDRGDLRIIPARAGFTSNRAPKKYAAQDHPRSRGVYTFVHLSWTALTGSSPLARGLRQARVVLQRQPLDHPRSRGVYDSLWLADYDKTGSSPLARGLLTSRMAAQ